MSSLKELRNRITSVRATQKITRAMQMVAASRLRRAQERAENGRLYTQHLNLLLSDLIESTKRDTFLPALVSGKEKEKTHLLIVCTTERGLCGGFNTRIIRLVSDLISQMQQEKKQVKIATIGKKGKDLLRRTHENLLIELPNIPDTRTISFSESYLLAKMIFDLFEKNEFDACSLIYAQFKSISSQIPCAQQLIPILPSEDKENTENPTFSSYEPEPEKILDSLVPLTLASQIFGSLLENAAGEMSARMMAMDNATRNAGSMIRSLSVTYNRQRQAQITKELIEIISGAEAI